MCMYICIYMYIYMYICIKKKIDDDVIQAGEIYWETK